MVKRLLNEYFKKLSLGEEDLYIIDLTKFVETQYLSYTKIVLLENHLLYTLDYKINNSSNINFDALQRELIFKPHRILMQDYTAIPSLIDWIAFQDKLSENDINLKHLNVAAPPVDIVIDHSLQNDFSNNAKALEKNIILEYARNEERFKFLKNVANTFKNINVFPPGSGICHQLNLENLANVIITKNNVVMSETMVGTDSHTTMINGLSVMGWGIGGIEATQVMMNDPIIMQMPEVVGVVLKGELRHAMLISDLALHITDILRKKNVVGKFLEFVGDGIISLTIPERATIANMTPEYGATCSYFPITQENLNYLLATGKSKDHVSKVERYAKEQNLWYSGYQNINYEDIIEIDLSRITLSVSGPSKPQDKLDLTNIPQNFLSQFSDAMTNDSCISTKNGDIVLSAITSCTNTSNPGAIFSAALLARNAYNLGLKPSHKIKTSFSPGSVWVEKYLKESGLLFYLEQLGFYITGYGCAACCGNSGELNDIVETDVNNNNLIVCSILSGNRNYESRIHRLIKANYLASPAIVVAYTLNGSILTNLNKDPITYINRTPIFLEELLPTNDEVRYYIKKFVKFSKRGKSNRFSTRISRLLWEKIPVKKSRKYIWDSNSTYIVKPPYINQEIPIRQNVVKDAHIFLILGDDISTDHISPVGEILANSPAADYLLNMGVSSNSFNSYGARRGNFEVMMRGAFNNPRLVNNMLDNITGPYTLIFPEKELSPIFQAALTYLNRGCPLIIFAGKNYGSGSSRDWAAKALCLLGVKAVVADSFERIHRSNLIGMGIYPFTLSEEINVKHLLLEGGELVDIRLLGNNIEELCLAECIIKSNEIEMRYLLRLEVYNSYEVQVLSSGGFFNDKFARIIKKQG